MHSSFGAQEAFEEGGILHGKRVYLFGCTERKPVYGFTSLPTLNSLRNSCVFWSLEKQVSVPLTCLLTTNAAQLVHFKDTSRVLHIPAVVAVSDNVSR